MAAAVSREMTSALPPLIVLGPPGAGKGTQAKRLAEENVRGAMAVGELVADEIVGRLVQERLEQLGHQRGFVLDGYPRTPQQAEALRGMLARLGRLERRPVVLWLEPPREELMRRLRHRAAHEQRPDATRSGATSVREQPLLASSSRQPNSGSNSPTRPG